jgi:cytochrome b561
MPSTESADYTKTAKVLHWLIALVLVFMLALGWSFDLFPKGETRFFLIQLHKSIGITILLLVLVRVSWRLTHKVPPLPASMPQWEQKTARIWHVFLYAAIIGMPLSGWAMVSASPTNIPTILYGIVPLPHLPILPDLDNRKEVAHILMNAHGFIATLLALLIVGHVAAALKHHFINHNDVLLRMLPRSWAATLNRWRGQV